MLQEDFWLFKEHAGHIKILDMTQSVFRNLIAEKRGLSLYKSKLEVDSVFDWNEMQPHHSFHFNYEGCEGEIKASFIKSDLSNYQNILIETASGMPIIEVPVPYFIDHWMEFVDSNQGQGSVMVTSDYSLLLEFTNDASYLLCSNFKI